MEDEILARRHAFTFQPTQIEGRHANILAAVVVFACLAISCAVLGLAFWLWRDRRLRHHFNKTSTELLFVCVAATIVQGLAVASTTLHLGGDAEAGFCKFGMIFVVIGFNATNWLQCCICVNLMLALRAPNIFRYPVKLWYYGTTIASSLCFAFIPLFFDQYAWNKTTHSCWIRDNGSLFNFWQLGILEFPIALVTIFMFVSTGFVILHILKQRREGKSHAETLNQLFEPAFDADADNLGITSETNMGKRFEIEELYVCPTFNPTMPPSPTTPPSKKSPRSGTWSPRAASFISNVKQTATRPMAPKFLTLDTAAAEETKSKTVRVARLPVSVCFGDDPTAQEKRQLRNTVLRISCYPLMHLLITVVPLLGSVFLSSAQHSSRRVQVALYYMTFIGSAWIPLGYSACAVLADTAIWDALQERRFLMRGDSEESLELALGRNKHRLSQLSAGMTPFDAVESPQMPADAIIHQRVSVVRTPKEQVFSITEEDEEDPAMQDEDGSEEMDSRRPRSHYVGAIDLILADDSWPAHAHDGIKAPKTVQIL